MPTKKKLSKTGSTNFKVQNMDWAFLDQALKNYQVLVDESPDEEFRLVTRQFAVDAVNRLIETFHVDL